MGSTRWVGPIFFGRGVSRQPFLRRRAPPRYTTSVRRVPISRQLRRLGEVFAEAGHEAWLVGGAVRDLLQRRSVGDFDVATDAPPETVMGLFRRTYPTGVRHGTVTVHYAGLQVEVTTFRTETGYEDGRHPDSVEFVGSIDDDLNRRDFTINGIAASLATGVVRDPHHGLRDLGAEVIRCIGDPGERFGEDGVRPLRACRFAAQLGFRVDGATLDAIGGSLGTVAQVSAERIRDELGKLLVSERPSVGLSLMEETGLGELLLPELHRCAGIAQPEMHCFDVLTHSLMSCDAATPELHLRLAALLHDVGKATTVAADEAGRPTFHGHERESARMAHELMSRLRFSNAQRDRVVHLVRHHMFNYDASWSDAAVRRFLARVGAGSVSDLLALRRADQIGHCGQRGVSGNLVELQRRIERVQEQGAALTVSDLAIDGSELMRELGITPGPAVGIILRELLETVVADPALNTAPRLLEIAANFYRERLAGTTTSGSGAHLPDPP